MCLLNPRIARAIFRLRHMWYSCLKNNKSGEAGFSMPELVIAVPILLLLAMGMLNVFLTGTRNYRNMVGDWELIQQVRVPMEEISRDMRYCGELKQENGSNYTILYIRRHHLSSAQYTANEYWQRYKITKNGQENYWITKNDQPVLGKTTLTDIVLNECSAQVLGNNKARVIIAGINQNTGHKFRLARTFYTYGYGLMPVTDDE